MKIDVCLVTKNDVQNIPGLDYIPLNNLIIETSTPLALARKRAIQKVSTSWFAFIDDDVKIDEEWFKTLANHTEDPLMGAIQGILCVEGLGEEWDKALNKSGKKPRSLKPGERGFTHNTLIRTELVKDWDPPPHLSAWEDYSLTQHILGKGYQWQTIPVKACHEKSWRGVWENAIWGVEGRKNTFPSKRDSLKQILRRMIWIIRVGLSLNTSWRVKAFRIYFNLAVIYGNIRHLARHYFAFLRQSPH